MCIFGRIFRLDFQKVCRLDKVLMLLVRDVWVSSSGSLRGVSNPKFPKKYITKISIIHNKSFDPMPTSHNLFSQHTKQTQSSNNPTWNIVHFYFHKRHLSRHIWCQVKKKLSSFPIIIMSSYRNKWLSIHDMFKSIRM